LCYVFRHPKLSKTALFITLCNFFQSSSISVSFLGLLLKWILTLCWYKHFTLSSFMCLILKNLQALIILFCSWGGCRNNQGENSNVTAFKFCTANVTSVSQFCQQNALQSRLPATRIAGIKDTQSAQRPPVILETTVAGNLIIQSTICPIIRTPSHS
jgi:hypothetical protein